MRINCLTQMPEEQSFCLLIKMMFEYEFRNLYRDGFENLRLKLYQLDRLIEVSVSVRHRRLETFPVMTSDVLLISGPTS